MMIRAACILVGFGLFMGASGCASGPAVSDPGATGERIGSEESPGLYDGGSEVLFATEFPVASAEDALTRAERALAEGKIDLALYMFVRAYDIDGENIHALMRIGQIHESRNNDRLAALAYNRVQVLDPDNAVAIQALGLIYLREKQHDKALALLEDAVFLNRALWKAYNGIGIIADLRGEHDRAIDAYNNALEARPRDASLLNNRGYSYYLIGDYENAARDLTAAASKGFERAWVNLGLLLARQGDYKKSVEMMSRVEKPEVAYNDVGYIAMRQDDLEVAETYFQKALQLAPRHFAEAQQNLAELRAITAARSPASESIVSSTIQN